VNVRLAILVICCLPPAWAQTPEPAGRAYEALRARDYDAAIPLFRQAIEAAPANATLRQDLGYAYLKAGENEAARDEFAEALRLDPSAERIALEYAFLCHETRKTPEARQTFDRIRKSGSAEGRVVAEQAFENIDRPLAEGITRWSAVVAQSPEDYSAHLELARLAEARNEPGLAAEHYVAAWKLRPGERQLLLDLARTWKEAGRVEDSRAALVVAARGSRPWVAEQARELAPQRCPYASEFRRGLELDPANFGMRRELVFLLLEVKQTEEAERELWILTDMAPADMLAAAQLGFLLLAEHDRAGAMIYLDRVLKSGDPELVGRVRAVLRDDAKLKERSTATGRTIGPKEMGERSLAKGYMKDAARYFEAAHEDDPADASVMLSLGWVHNALHQDEVALGWFDQARQSSDPQIAAEAGRAYRNLRPTFARWRFTAWALPFYSSRWNDLFSYGQAKAEYRLGNLPFRPYFSVRFIGDVRGSLPGTTPGAPPMCCLSEKSFVLGAGVATRTWHRAMAWAEAGAAMRYSATSGSGFQTQDYRGGVSYGRGWGRLMGSEAPGWFAETHGDGVFVSRFNNDLIGYAQNQLGYTVRPFSGLRVQLYGNVNITADAKRQSWANFFEAGPGLRFRWAAMPPALVFSVNALRGTYLQTAKQVNDMRVGFWYALTR
jgi:Flp pilus assembly protein TadD